MTTTMALQQKISEEEEEVVVVAEEKLAQKHVPLYWLGVASVWAKNARKTI